MNVIFRVEKRLLRNGFGRGESGLIESVVSGPAGSQSIHDQRWSMCRTVKGLSNRHQLDPFSGHSYYHSLEKLGLCPPGCAGGEK